jgi:hypothetical protein
MNCCLACGVDVENAKKSRHPLSDSDITPLLVEFATSAVESIPSQQGSKLQLDVQQFKSGYVCRSCYREVLKLHSLQKQLKEANEALANKLTRTACLLPSTTHIGGTLITNQSHQSPDVRRKRSLVNIPTQILSPRNKRRRILQAVRSVPTSSNKSPDVAVSSIVLKKCMPIQN